MQINPLDTIREETTLLKLFQSTMSESAYIDTIVKDIFEQQNEIRQMIYRKNDNYVYLKLDNLNNLLKELNEKIKPRNLRCSIENVSSKDFSNMIFDTEEELKEHGKRHETERKKYSYSSKTSKLYKKWQQEHEEWLKSRDRTR